MNSEDEPSKIVSKPYIVYPAKQPPFVHGKWLFFYPKGAELDKAWQLLKYQVMSYYEGIVYIKASTAVPHSHASDQSQGVIMVFCEDKLLPIKILEIGKYLVQALKYKSSIGNKVYYKADGLKSTWATTNTTNNHTFSILHYVETHEVIKHSPPQPTFLSNHENDTCMKMSDCFQVDPHQKNIAKQLGCVWDTHLKQWCAPNDKVWNKMIAYFEQIDDKTESKTFHLDTFSIYSMNVWSHQSYISERMIAIFESIERHQPDVLCLQEITCESFDILDALLRPIGFTTLSRFNPQLKFTCMLYFNTMTIQPIAFEQHPFPISTMRREWHMLQAQHKASQRIFKCSTAHLEPGVERQAMRLDQLQHMLTKLEHKDPNDINPSSTAWVFAGDTNIAYYQEEHIKHLLPNHIHDAWEQCGKKLTTKSTWNPATNTHLKTVIPDNVGSCRFDRILYSANYMQAVQFDLTCQNTIPLIDEKHASDHYGIVSHLKFI